MQVTTSRSAWPWPPSSSGPGAARPACRWRQRPAHASHQVQISRALAIVVIRTRRIESCVQVAPSTCTGNSPGLDQQALGQPHLTMSPRRSTPCGRAVLTARTRASLGQDQQGLHTWSLQLWGRAEAPACRTGARAAQKRTSTVHASSPCQTHAVPATEPCFLPCYRSWSPLTQGAMAGCACCSMEGQAAAAGRTSAPQERHQARLQRWRGRWLLLLLPALNPKPQTPNPKP